MRTYSRNENVEPGLYFNLRRLSLKSVDCAGPLEGLADTTYRRVPMLVMLGLAPLLGLVYVIFLPLIGFAMVTWLVGAKAGRLAAGVAANAARVVRPGWEPSLAFLSRSKPATKAKHDDDATDAWSEDVEKKLNETGEDET